MKIIHFSDPHAGGPAEDWLAYLDKRWVGVFNYRFRRKFQHDLSNLEKAVAYILERRPDLAVCTGDLTSTGQPGEFARVTEILAPLRDSDIPVFYVPGNHDFYVYRRNCVEAMKAMIAWLTRDRYTFATLPAKITLGELDFLIVNESWPSNLLSSHGWMRPAYSSWLENVCREPQVRPRVLIGHYPLNEKHPLLRCRHRLYGQRRALRLLREGKIDLSLCGHVHLPHAGLDDRGRGEIIAGSVTRNHCLAEIDYHAADNLFRYRNIILP